MRSEEEIKAEIAEYLTEMFICSSKELPENECFEEAHHILNIKEIHIALSLYQDMCKANKTFENLAKEYYK
jgi:hypothetical protein